MKLLHIDAGITGPGAVSRQISAAIVENLIRANPGLEVVRRDLDADPIPHLDSRNVGALRAIDGEELEGEAARTATLLREFQEADVVVLGPRSRLARSRRRAVATRRASVSSSRPEAETNGSTRSTNSTSFL